MTDLPPDIIDDPALYFPDVFVNEIAKALQDHLPDCAVVPRPLGAEDVSMSIGVFTQDWNADEDTYVMGQFEPVEASYVIRVQCMVKALNHSDGRRAHSNLAKAIRVILYRDTTLQLRLRESSEELLSSIERVNKFAVTRTEFLSGRAGTNFMFMATTYIRIGTSTTFLN